MAFNVEVYNLVGVCITLLLKTAGLNSLWLQHPPLHCCSVICGHKLIQQVHHGADSVHVYMALWL